MSAYGLSREQNVDMLVRTALECGITDQRQIAYIPATAQHETGDFRTAREDDGPAQAVRNGYRGGENYYERGCAQTTHVDRYAAMDATLGLKGRLKQNPDLAATDARLAAQMTVVGIGRGSTPVWDLSSTSMAVATRTPQHTRSSTQLPR